LEVKYELAAQIFGGGGPITIIRSVIFTAAEIEATNPTNPKLSEKRAIV
jgi:hypothetical protein